MNLSKEGKTAIDGVGRQRLPIRLVFLALPLGFGLLLLIAALVVLASASKARPLPPGIQTTALARVEETPITPTSTPHTPAQLELSHQRTPTQVSPPSDNVVAQVNGQDIGRQVLQTMWTADLAMAELLGQPPPSADDLLDRLVNGELVRQAAGAAGFVLEEDQVDQQLQNFLATKGKSMADLESSLAAHDLSLDDFKLYFGQLLLVDQFSRTQAQARGNTVSEYLRQLQRDARISFGPPTEEMLAQTQPSTSQPTPQTLTTPPPGITRGTNPGQYPPFFELPALNYPTGDFLTTEDLGGKPTLLSFWTTWCGYCRRQTPVLVDAHARYGESVQFVGINVREDQQQAVDYVKSNGISYPIALDLDGQVASRYGIRGFPTTYFLDEEGRIVARYVGSLSPEQVESYLQQLLSVAGP